MKRMETSEYKQILKNMLEYIHQVCTNNNIRYFVSAGTLIGTIRHSGFIPWDDDIDIWMPYEDYLKFKKIVSDSDGLYYLLSPEDNKYYYHVFSRFCSKEGRLELKDMPNIENLGPFIDIFVLHKASYDKAERLKVFNSILEYNKKIKFCLPLKYYKSVSFKTKIWLLTHLHTYIINRFFVGISKLKSKRDEVVCSCDHTESKLYYSASGSRCFDAILFREEDLNNPICHKFEDIEVNIPPNYHELLTKRYGDYMQLPPVEERHTRHHFTTYYPD